MFRSETSTGQATLKGKGVAPVFRLPHGFLTTELPLLETPELCGQNAPTPRMLGSYEQQWVLLSG